jgi:hypothetical protein
MEAEEESEAKRGDAEGQENLKVLNTANASGKRYILEGIMHLLSFVLLLPFNQTHWDPNGTTSLQTRIRCIFRVRWKIWR